MATRKRIYDAEFREGEQALFAYIEGFYNPRRRHSANGHLSPAEYERRHTAEPSVSLAQSAA
jgi:putative transposase